MRVEEVPAAGGAAAREEGERRGEGGGEGLIAGQEEEGEEGAGDEGGAEGGEDTGAGDTIAEMNVGSEGTGPVPQEEDTASVQGVGRRAPRRAHHAGGRCATRALRVVQPWAPREARR